LADSEVMEGHQGRFARFVSNGLDEFLTPHSSTMIFRKEKQLPRANMKKTAPTNQNKQTNKKTMFVNLRSSTRRVTLVVQILEKPPGEIHTPQKRHVFSAPGCPGSLKSHR